LRRRTPLTRKSIDQVRAEAGRQQASSSAQRQAARQREDEQWRVEVLDLRGPYCRSCGSVRDVQADHLVGRVGEDRLAVEAGLPLCGDFGDGRCHPRKTARQLLIQRSWLDSDQVEWLEEKGYAIWGPDGTVVGRRCRLFADVGAGTAE
jgi:hypothetical protein